MASVAVVGPGEATPELCRHAADIAAALAGHGLVVVTGGGSGVMAAAEQAALAAGGTVLALLPGEADERGRAHPRRHAVPTGLGQGRNLLVVRAAAVVVAVGGSWGTLSEVALACRLGLPVVGLASWTVTTADGVPVPGVEAAMDAADAVAKVLTYLPA